ncbi:MAG: hypothetical protein ACRYFS_04525 [Janthinobacterium lividum]
MPELPISAGTLRKAMYKEALKGKAYAFTLLALLWTLFSGFGVFDWLDSHRPLTITLNTAPDLIIWCLQALFISLALHFALTEQSKPTLCVSKDLWMHLAAHTCGWILFANLPLFALWHTNLVSQLFVHGLLMLVSLGGLALLRRTKMAALKVGSVTT